MRDAGYRNVPTTSGRDVPGHLAAASTTSQTTLFRGSTVSPGASSRICGAARGVRRLSSSDLQPCPRRRAGPVELDVELFTALAAIPERDRELLLLVYWEDLEPRRAARALGCSRATVATRLWRAHRRLRAELEEERWADMTSELAERLASRESRIAGSARLCGRGPPASHRRDSSSRGASAAPQPEGAFSLSSRQR